MFGKKEPNHQADFEVFVIYDAKTSSYEMPSFAINRHDLIRQITNLFTEPGQARNRFLVNAEDFSIFKIGSYDKKTGTIAVQNLEHIANMHELRSMANIQMQAQPTPNLNTNALYPT